jgi:hypothetical protein
MLLGKLTISAADRPDGHRSPPWIDLAASDLRHRSA